VQPPHSRLRCELRLAIGSLRARARYGAVSSGYVKERGRVHQEYLEIGEDNVISGRFKNATNAVFWPGAVDDDLLIQPVSNVKGVPVVCLELLYGIKGPAGLLLAPATGSYFVSDSGSNV
jgi:hypothetical protein